MPEDEDKREAQKKDVETRELIADMYEDPFNAAMGDMLLDCRKVLARKRHDYGDYTFIEAAENATILCGREIRSYEIAAMLIGIKMARYGFLIGVGREGLHESIADTVANLINYIALMERERQKYEHSHKTTETTEEIT